VTTLQKKLETWASLRKRRTIIVLVIVILIGILIYSSPDESHKHQNVQGAIEKGRIYAYYLLISDKKQLSKMSISPAKEKIDSSSLQRPLFERATLRGRMYIRQRLEDDKIPECFISPLSPILSSEKKDAELDLVLLEKCDIFVVMTFAYKDFFHTVEIPEKGKMLFSIATRYYEPEDERLFSKSVRRAANLPLLNKITGHLGTKGKWVVFDYMYKYNLNDYLEWITGEGRDKLRKQEKSNDFVSQLKTKQGLEKFMIQIKELAEKAEESAERSLAFLYQWGSIKVKEQIELVEELYKAEEEFIEDRKSNATEPSPF
jgi:hypothetical protein